MLRTILRYTKNDNIQEEHEINFGKITISYSNKNSGRKDIANDFNELFLNTCRTLVKKIPKCTNNSRHFMNERIPGSSTARRVCSLCCGLISMQLF